MASEAQRKARNKYNAQRKRIALDFSPTETDLYNHITQQENKQGYIKDLIRKDMNNDTPNIVRCKDCVYYTDFSPYLLEGECDYFSNEDNLYSVNQNGYCSNGTAKTKGE